MVTWIVKMKGRLVIVASPLKIHGEGSSLVVQWLRFHSPNVGGLDLIPDQGTRFLMLQLKDS